MGKTYTKRGQDEQQGSKKQANKRQGFRDKRDPFDATAFVDKRVLKRQLQHG